MSTPATTAQYTIIDDDEMERIRSDARLLRASHEDPTIHARIDELLADPSVTVHHGDCLEVMRSMPDASVDAVVTDPPYGLEFMGKDWDRFDEDSRARAGMSGTGYTDGAERLERPSFLGGLNPKCRSCGKWQRGGNPCSCDSPNFPNERRARSAAFGEWCELWTAECLRVLKPGGHLLAFGGTRTWHRLVVAVEDAGFEIRDSIAWLYGSGFPKSLDVSKSIDKAAGAEREVVGKGRAGGRSTLTTGNPGLDSWRDARAVAHDYDYTAPATPDAERWQGWGTALKPSFEPIVVARKPLVGTVAANVLAHGTGALNIDACRVGHDSTKRSNTAEMGYHGGNLPSQYETGSDSGRWPTNAVLDGHTADALDEQSGFSKSPAPYVQATKKRGEVYNLGSLNDKAGKVSTHHGDSGGASRFFPTFRYQAKAPARERPRVDGVAHPTVKPLELMRWLVRLVTPPGGVVLDPFAGSGATVEAALLEGFACIAIEREADYLPLIQVRIDRQQQPGQGAARGSCA